MKKKTVGSILATVTLGLAISQVGVAAHENRTTSLSDVYNDVVEMAWEIGKPLALSYDTFVQEYYENKYWNLTEAEIANDLICEYAYMEQSLSDINKINVYSAYTPSLLSSSSSSNSSKSTYYYNTGTSCPIEADYSKYDLVYVLMKGDIVYEAVGPDCVSGHIAIVEGVFFDYTLNKRYVRVIEANPSSGVTRGILDDKRVDERNIDVYRVSEASWEQKKAAVEFCIKQLGKEYSLLGCRNSSENAKTWYCSQLVWAAYKSEGIDLETQIGGTHITPNDITVQSDLTTKVSLYK